MAKSGFAVKLQRSSDGTSGRVFTDLGELREITPPESTRETPDATHFDSPDGYREFTGDGLRDGGELSGSLLFNPSGTTLPTLYSDLNSDDAGYYRVLFLDGSTLDMAAFITAVGHAIPKEDVMELSFTAKVTGKPIFTQA